MSVAGLILAAGESRRMGFPKALLDAGGETLLDRMIGMFGACCDPVIVVLGYHAEKIEAECLRLAEASVVKNPRPERGQLSSLQCGLRAAPPEWDGVMFTPVDYPLLKPSTVALLAAEFKRWGAEFPVIAPACDGRHGHPVCVGRALIREFLALPPEGQAREVIHRYQERTRYVEVADAGTLRDADNPAEYRRMMGSSSEA